MEIFTPAGIEAFLTVAVIDLVLAGDNAVVIGMAAAGLERQQRGKAILIGILVATLLRIGFALVASQLLTVIGLLLAGGILCCGCAGKCGANCGPRPEPLRRRLQLCKAASTQLPPRQQNRWGRRSCRSSSPTFRCRSIMS